MTLPLPIRYTKAAEKYLEALDTKTKKRVKDKIACVAGAPDDLQYSYPLTSSTKRSCRIGKYRVLILVSEEALIVSDIASRGQVYRNA